MFFGLVIFDIDLCICYINLLVEMEMGWLFDVVIGEMFEVFFGNWVVRLFMFVCFVLIMCEV